MTKTDLLPLLLLISFIFLSTRATSQCGDVIFTTQTEVNAFSCSGAVSSMTFQDAAGTSDPIVNLVPIWSQGIGVSVLGDLIVNNCDDLTTLDGLDRIQSVGGDFLVYQNASLIEINDPSWPFLMTSIAGTLEVSNNPLLASHTDLNQLSTLGKVNYSGNTTMTVLGGFNSLTSIGDHVIITGNANLTTVNAFPLISSVVGSIFVTGNSSLSNCCNSIYDLYVAERSVTSQVNSNAPGCNSVSEIDDPKSYLLKTQNDVDNFRPCAFGVVDLIIDGDGISENFIINLNPISSYGGDDLTISGDLNIRNCSALTTLDGLDRIVSVGGDFKVESNPSLTAINHPDWPFQLTTIGDELRIENNTILASHSDLNSLETVGGFIRYYANTNLVTLAGFDGLTTAGHIDIGFNDALESLPSFSLLSSAGFIGIRWNVSLAAINTFPVLESAERVLLSQNANLLTIDGFNNLLVLATEDDNLVSLQIHDNGQLHTISGFNSLASINGDPDLEDDSFEIFNNSSLSIVTAFGSLSVVQGPTVVIDNASLGTCCWLAPIIAGTTGSVELMNNASGCNTEAEVSTPQSYLLTTQADVNNFSPCAAGVIDLIIDGADISEDAITSLFPIYQSGITAITGDLIIRNCSDLSTLDGLDFIISVGGELKIEANSSLVNIHDPSWPFQLATIGESIWIDGNPLLSNLDDFNALTSLGYGMNILSNESLLDVNGFNALEEVGDWVRIVNNNALTQIDEFPELESISSILWIGNSMNLTNMGSYPALTSTEGFVIKNNPLLQSIPNFNSVTGPIREFEISNNPSITSIDGFNGITSWEFEGHGLQIFSNASLQSISGFGALSYIQTETIENFGEAALRISNNSDLIAVDAFQSLTSVFGDLDVTSNNMLSTCCWLDPIIAVTSENISVANNATGCNSEAEIDAACPEVADCPGDFNGDGFVNSGDFLVLNSAFNATTPCTDCTADMNNDGLVNTDDFIEYNSVFGTDCSIVLAQDFNLSGLNQELIDAIDKQSQHEIHPELLKVIMDMRTGFDFSIVPNPNNGRQFKLAMIHGVSLKQSANLKIHDMTGRIVYEESSIQLTSGIEINTSTPLSTGLYIVTLTQEGKVTSSRMTVK